MRPWSVMLMLAALLLAAERLAAQDPGMERADSLDWEERLGAIGEGEERPIDAHLAPDPPSPRRSIAAIRSRLSWRTELPQGYRDGTYLGSPLKSYHRIRVTPSDGVSAGVVLEKDPGERRIDDFLAGHLSFRGTGIVRTAVLGDYVVESGQGLSFWRGIDVGRGSDVSASVERKDRGPVPYLSAGEDAFMRGGAVTIGLGAWTLSCFASWRSHDAALDGEAATALSGSGFFRTPAEESRRGTLIERLVGTAIRYRSTSGSQAGVTFSRSLLSRELRLGGGARFKGERIALVSADYRIAAGPWTLFGEWGYGNGAAAGSSGCILRAAQGVELVASLRWYPRRFVSLHGYGASDEEGVYCAVRLVPHRRVALSAYAESNRAPAGEGAVGIERFFQLDVLPAERCRVAMRYVVRESDWEEPIRDAHGLLARWPQTASRRSLRLTVDYRVSSGTRFRARWEQTRSSRGGNGEEERGTLVLQDLSGKLSSALRWSLRAALFRASSYDARIIAYEPDLDGATSMPALYGEGLRWSCVLRWAASNALVFSGKFSMQIRDDVRRVGAGSERLPGNRDGKISVQVDLER